MYSKKYGPKNNKVNKQFSKNGFFDDSDANPYHCTVWIRKLKHFLGMFYVKAPEIQNYSEILYAFGT